MFTYKNKNIQIYLDGPNLDHIKWKINSYFLFNAEIVFKFASFGSIGYVDTQCISSNEQLFFLNILTALSISETDDIPVEINVCFCFFEMFSKSLLSLIIAEETLLNFKLK